LKSSIAIAQKHADNLPNSIPSRQIGLAVSVKVTNWAAEGAISADIEEKAPTLGDREC
jgi:hypothetical protein